MGVGGLGRSRRGIYSAKGFNFQQYYGRDNIKQNEPFLARRWVRPFASSTRASRGSGGSFAVAKSLSVLEAVVCRGGCACGCY